ncbi:hypothetical protein ACILE2_04530 [Capnocytophaga canimorsus]|uniref:hypothetical protein n=1 Tax=Capnocytophaga canimorsus TaxID=28188 RepID=UPI0037D63633
MKKVLIFLAGLAFFSCKTNNKNQISKDLINTQVVSDVLDFQPEYLNEISSLGVGVVNPKDYTFTLYADTLIQNPIEIENIEIQELITPLIYKPDYLIFYMVVEEKSDKWYKIIYNHNKIGYVLSEEFTFYTWENLLKEAKGVIAKQGCTDKNNEQAITQLSEQDFYLIEKIDNDWIYVRKEVEEGVLEEDGYWIKWRDKNQLNVRPIFLD